MAQIIGSLLADYFNAFNRGIVFTLQEITSMFMYDGVFLVPAFFFLFFIALIITVNGLLTLLNIFRKG